MLRRIFIATLLLAPLTVSAQLSPGIPAVGKDYVVLSPVQPTWGKGGIEVAEVFSYSCIHCAEFQPLVNAWKKKQPADVRFTYVPAVFGGVWDNAARAYFAAEALGVQAKTHDAIFKAFFIDKTVKSGSIDDLADVYASLGVNRSKMLEAMNGFTVSSKLNRARQFALRAGVNSTPTMVINGKYRVLGGPGGGQQGMLITTDYLVQKERAALKATSPTSAPAKTK
ncbi:MAG: thiol:disulfide interchange protein DsbA/DsbL [Arenimonas sp.]|nr:thiol:disulfide interchange protein DsbA/DsbL [Arenimonas sp.]